MNKLPEIQPNYIIHKPIIQWLIAINLLLIMAGTRYNQIDGHIIPDASIAVFFAGGFYLRRFYFPIFLSIAGLVDLISITYGGISGFCITAAYFILAIAYALVWFLGFLFTKYYQPDQILKTIITFLIFLAIALFGYEILASGSFYLISGYFNDQSIFEFITREIKYFPFVVISFLGYISIFCGIHLLVHVLSKYLSKQRNTNPI